MQIINYVTLKLILDINLNLIKIINYYVYIHLDGVYY